MVSHIIAAGFRQQISDYAIPGKSRLRPLLGPLKPVATSAPVQLRYRQEGLANKLQIYMQKGLFIPAINFIVLACMRMLPNLQMI